MRDHLRYERMNRYFTTDLLRPLLASSALLLGVAGAALVVRPQLLPLKPVMGDVNIPVFLCVIILTCLALLCLMVPEPAPAPVAEAQPDAVEKAEAEAEHGLMDQLNRIITLLNTHSESSRIYSLALDEAGRSLIEATSPEQLRLAIGYLITENNKMRKETTDLQGNLQEQQLQIEALRSNLAEAEETGMRDALTTVWNRRAFDKMLAHQAHEAQRKQEPLSLILADIDHFKKINDRFGHQLGDEVIRLVAATLSRNVKGKDTVARYGGEEFALILPQTSLENAVSVAQQIKRQLETQRWAQKHDGHVLGSVTASFGVAQLQPKETRDVLLQRTDKKLYDAKNRGRNCIVY
jgi:diguanylate cyclase